MLIKEYHLPERVPFTEDKKERIVRLLKSQFEDVKVRQDTSWLEIVAGGNPFKTKVYVVRRAPEYIVIPQYEIRVEGENPSQLLESIEKILFS